MLPTQRPTASPVQTQPLATPVTPPPRVVQNSPMVVTPPSTNRRQLAFHITNKKVVPTNDAIFPRVQNKSTLVQIILQQLQTLLQQSPIKTNKFNIGTNFRHIATHHLANHVYNDKGKKEIIESLLSGPMKKVWTKSLSNEYDRLTQGNQYMA